MFKRLFFLVFGLLGSILLVFTVYRASVGLGPLHLSAIFDLLGDSFSDTSNRLELVFVQFQDAIDGVVNVSNYEFFKYSKAQNFGDFLISFTQILATRTLSVVTWFFVLIWRIVQVFVALIQDMSDVIRILGFFLIGSSPYPVSPYYPVG